MAARTNKPLHDDKTKERIRASQLLNRLTQCANGEVELSPAQIQAAKIVIGKIIPDLKAIEHSGPDGGPVQSSVTVEFIGTVP
jgi:hypothetical protein